jgi:putative membrane-bound dehydrogenase-like protein
MRTAPLLLTLVLAAAALGASLVVPQEDARRLEVLFFGAPTANHAGHDPITRYKVLKKHLGADGINLTYLEDPAVALHSGTLKHFDAVLMYGNWAQHGPMPAKQEKALVRFVENGGGFLPIHCASACYGKSEAFVELVGGVFKSHGGEVFAPKTTNPAHPVTKGYEGFEAWDETYVHARHGDDRTILQERDGEPWTWVRNQGKGRIFYTASGHDHRVWDLPQYHDLLKRAIYWSVGEEAMGKLDALKLPEFEMMEVRLPGYLKRELVTSVPKPFSPEESLKLAQVPPGFELSLFAADPDIVNPIFISWDERGRAFVIETIDYPNNLQAGNLGHDRIKICEDTDGDGRADKFTVFADKLSIPTTLVFANGGVICTNGSDVLFLKDTDGDDVADERKVLFSGIKTGDTHAGTSNFRYGFDNWIWATTGYSGFDGEVGGKRHKFSTGVYRFKPDASALEFIQNTTNNTWGLGFTEEFDIHGSTANANPSWYLTFPRRYYEQAGLPQPRTPRADDNPDFFPSSTDIRQVDAHNKYTSGAGHAFYTARRFPKDYWNRIAFICGPTGKLVGKWERFPKGAGFTLKQSPNNLYNSADAWSGPVCAEVGPDGAVWICDWYNIVIQHNPTPNKQSTGLDAQRGKGNAYVTPHRDKQHGRIYRVYPKGSKNDSYTADLKSPNLFWRLAAQRAAVEKGEKVETVANVHDFYVMAGTGSLDLDTIVAGLGSNDPGLRRAALRNAPLDDTLAKMFIVDGRITESDPRTVLELLLALSRIAPSDQVGAALARLATDQNAKIHDDPILNDAFKVATTRHAAGFIKVSVAKGEPGKASDLQAIASRFGETASPGAKAKLEAFLLERATTQNNAFAQSLLATIKESASGTEVAPRTHKPDPAVHERGAAVYARTCIACHGPEGLGVPSAFPPLDGSDWLTGDPKVPIKILLNGLLGPIEVKGQKFNNVMPAHINLSDQDLSDVLTYARQNWSNDAAPVGADQAKTVREATKDRATFWTPKELR